MKKMTEQEIEQAEARSQTRRDALTLEEKKAECLRFVRDVSKETNAFVCYLKCNSIRNLLIDIEKEDPDWFPFDGPSA